MLELKSVVNINTYGNISIHLKEIIEEKNITRYRLAKLVDTRFEVVEKWCSGTVERIDADVESKLIQTAASFLGRQLET